MRILIVYQYFGTPNGSWSTRIYELARRWVSKGHDVTVITSPYDKSDIKAIKFITKLKIEGINVLIINSGDSNRFSTIKRFKKALVFALVSSIYCIFIKADVLITSSGPITVGLSGLFGRWFSKKKWVFEVRDLWPDGGIEMGKINGEALKKLALFAEKIIYKKANFIIAASDGQRDFVLKKGVCPSKIGIVYNGSDNELFGIEKELSNVDKDIIGNRPYFLHIGSLGFIHNVNYIIDAAISLKKMDSNVLIVLIGDGAEKEILQMKVRQNELDNVFFLGQIQKKEIIPWLNHCIATLFCTLNYKVQNTCSPNKVFDSFAAAKPVIQTTEGWIKDLFNEQNCGVNVNPNAPKEMAEAMVNYVLNPELCKQHGLNAKNLAKSVFDRDVLSNQYLKYIEKI